MLARRRNLVVGLEGANTLSSMHTTSWSLTANSVYNHHRTFFKTWRLTTNQIRTTHEKTSRRENIQFQNFSETSFWKRRRLSKFFHCFLSSLSFLPSLLFCSLMQALEPAAAFSPLLRNSLLFFWWENVTFLLLLLVAGFPSPPSSTNCSVCCS